KSAPRPTRLRGRLIRWIIYSAVGSALLVTAGWLALPLVPLPAALFTPQSSELELLDRTGQPLRVVRRDDGPFHGPVDYSAIPPTLLQATIAAEDHRFWRHSGVDWRA